MANNILSPTVITREAIRVLHNNLVIGKNCNRQYDDRFAQGGAKIGTSLQIRRPNQFTVRSGATASVQDVQEYANTLTVATQRGIDFQFSSVELTMTIDDFSNRYIQPAMSRLASEIDFLLMQNAYQAAGNTVGTPGTTPNTALVWLQAGQKLDEFAAPRDNLRIAAMNPAAQASTVDALKGLFQSSEKISDQYNSGMMGQALGFNFFMSQNVNAHTVGPLGGTPLVNGASQGIATGWAETTSLITDGWTAAAANRLKAGDVITITGVNAVNPETKQSTGALMQFVVTADASSDGAGNLTAIISPAIIRAGAYQNVTGAPADNVAITVVGTASTAYPQNLTYHKNAIALVTADLELPKGVDMASRETYDNFSMRFIRDYDSTNDVFLSRFDVLFGFKTVRPEHVCRVWG